VLAAWPYWDALCWRLEPNAQEKEIEGYAATAICCWNLKCFCTPSFLSRIKLVLQARPSQNVSAISPRQRCQPFRNCRPVQRASGERWFEDESSEWGKIKHVQQLKAHGHKTEEEEESEQSSQEDEEANEEEAEQSEEADADEEKTNQSSEDEKAEWYIYCTKEPYSFDAYLGESTDEDEE